MYFKKLNDLAILPTRSHEIDAGVDLYAIENVILRGHHYSDDISNRTFQFDTGIGVFIPRGSVGLIWDKSGLGDRLIKVFGGVIDSGYTASIKVRLLNMGVEDWEVKVGTKIAQLIIQKCDLSEPRWADAYIERLAERSGEAIRGEKGFGSTG